MRKLLRAAQFVPFFFNLPNRFLNKVTAAHGQATRFLLVQFTQQGLPGMLKSVTGRVFRGKDLSVLMASRDMAGSFWDLSDPDFGWYMGKNLIGDHDVLHLLLQPTESLTHSLAWNACQVLSLASAFQLREERSRNSETIGKTLLTSTGEKAIEGYQALSAFRYDVLQQALTIHDQVVVDCQRQLRETKLVSEDIVRMIEPSVPEPGDENNEELLGILGEILVDMDDDDMIEALRQNPI
ncbi:ATP-dependent Clp protease proteolytic subunit-related protein 4, chloroplastic-like [Dorcoceras hygrometricum]|uniref:ATP-dependent Clp protease proteolytic subunit-related protein 4, chloroplastic-like n=1 Tax=Dorcoceras hygrometricum TaxID=472368 RepID=A0A2Z7A2U4_9LAMI|nr:ATP-dependent Clp protease proteolytic subunit-related protein 4, chloroplastic-like [Dorcoceras hygrometricum]